MYVVKMTWIRLLIGVWWRKSSCDAWSGMALIQIELIRGRGIRFRGAWWVILDHLRGGEGEGGEWWGRSEFEGLRVSGRVRSLGLRIVSDCFWFSMIFSSDWITDQLAIWKTDQKVTWTVRFINWKEAIGQKINSHVYEGGRNGMRCVIDAPTLMWGRRFHQITGHELHRIRNPFFFFRLIKFVLVQTPHAWFVSEEQKNPSCYITNFWCIIQRNRQTTIWWSYRTR